MSSRQFDPFIPERMDIVEAVTPELESDLANLEKLNRFFGAYHLIAWHLHRFLKPGKTYRLLDLCTGSGDIPRFIIGWARRRNIALHIDAVDFLQPTLTIARARSERFPEIRFLRADARSFSAADPYDGVLCSLALHHFSETAAVAVLQNMRRLAKNFVLVADLERNWLTTAGVWFITATVFRQPMTVHDARLSARRAFSFREFRELATIAGWQNVEHRRFLFGRQAISS
ncbi:MAG TPA: methyltransferase domain-containing protein [Chthoniobacterales bacterium]